MKLSDLHIALVAKRLNVQALDPEDDATKMLVDTFGDHTFYLDPGGLNIFEHSTSDAGDSLILVKIADWVDGTRTGFQPIEPDIKPVAVLI